MTDKITGKQDDIKLFIQREIAGIATDNMQTVLRIILFLHQGNHVCLRLNAGHIESGFCERNGDPSGSAAKFQYFCSVRHEQHRVDAVIIAVPVEHIVELGKEALKFIIIMFHLFQSFRSAVT